MTDRPRTLTLYLLGAVFLGLSALLGGVGLILDPTGASLGLPLTFLEGSPFGDYLLPGLLLFSVFGIGSFAEVVGILQGRAWSWLGAVSLGGGQVIWIVVQLAIIGELHPLHLLYGGLGLALLGLAVTPSVRRALGGPGVP